MRLRGWPHGASAAALRHRALQLVAGHLGLSQHTHRVCVFGDLQLSWAFADIPLARLQTCCSVASLSPTHILSEACFRGRAALGGGRLR